MFYKIKTNKSTIQMLLPLFKETDSAILVTLNRVYNENLDEDQSLREDELHFKHVLLNFFGSHLYNALSYSNSEEFNLMLIEKDVNSLSEIIINESNLLDNYIEHLNVTQSEDQENLEHCAKLSDMLNSFMQSIADAEIVTYTNQQIRELYEL